MNTFNSFKIGAVLISLLLTAPILFGQKLKKAKWGYFNYIQPRATTELDNAEYFFLSVEISDDEVYRRKLIEQEFGVEKFKAAGVDNNTDFIVKIVESPFKFNSPAKKSYAKKYTENGVEKSRNMYYYEGTMDYHYILKVLDADGNEIFRDIQKGVQKTKGGASESQIDAHSTYVKDKLKFKETNVKKVSNKFADAFNDFFTDKSMTIHIRGVNVVKKQYEYPEFNKTYDKLKRAYDILNVNNAGNDESNALLSESITFLKDFLKDSAPLDKKSRVNASVTAAANYNLGLAYFLSMDYENAQIHFEEALSYDKGIVAGIQNWVYVSKTCAERLSNHSK